MKSQAKIRIGVLAVQGAFQAHKPHIEALGAEYVEVLTRKDFENINGLILPGGESSTMLKLVDFVKIRDAIKEFLKTKPVWGICAGAILMANKVYDPEQESFGAIDIEVTRNAFGRHRESFEEIINDYKVSYIRAPKITKISLGLTVLSFWEGSPTWVESDLHLVTTFHPEMNLDYGSPWHLRLIERSQKQTRL
jgi:5'-phosphate synthase pdxT subunit